MVLDFPRAELVAKEGSLAQYRYIVLQGACVATKDPASIDHEEGGGKPYVPWAWLRHQITLTLHSMRCFQEKNASSTSCLVSPV